MTDARSHVQDTNASVDYGGLRGCNSGLPKLNIYNNC